MSDTEVEKLLDTITVLNKVSFEFFSATTYTENGKKLNSEFIPYASPLSASLINHKAFSVIPETVEYTDSYIYSDQIIGSESTFDLYSASIDYTRTMPASTRDSPNNEFPKNAYYSFTFHMAQTKEKTTAT